MLIQKETMLILKQTMLILAWRGLARRGQAGPSDASSEKAMLILKRSMVNQKELCRFRRSCADSERSYADSERTMLIAQKKPC